MLNLIKLESRIVLDGAGVGEAVGHAVEHDAHAHENGKDHVPDHENNGDQKATVAEAAALLADAPDAATEPLDIVLVSDNLPDYQTLVDAVNPQAQVIVYDGDAESTQDVIDRVTALSQESGRPIDSLTVLSHGGSGYFELGNEKVTADNLDDNADAWADLDDSMAEDGHIYVYGCGVADDSGHGMKLLNGLSKATGAEVHASDDVTGKGGDWDLEAVSKDGHNSADDSHPPMDLALLDGYSGDLQNELIFVPPTQILGSEDARSGIVITLFVKNTIDADDVTFELNPINGAGVINADSILPIQPGSQTLYQPDSTQTQPPPGYTGYTWVALYSPNVDKFHINGQKSPIEITAAAQGISETETYSLEVLPLNDAPVLLNQNGEEIPYETGSLDFGTPIKMSVKPEEDDPDPDGQTVSSLVNSRIIDVDGDPEGIAVVGVDNSQGQWEYKIGNEWAPLNDNISETNATLLDGNAEIRFVPEGEWSIGDPVESLQFELDFKAWDHTDGGSSGDTGVNTDLGPRPSKPGDTASLSQATGTIQVEVTPVNDSPVVNSGLDFGNMVEDEDPLTQGAKIDALIDGNFISDPDGPDVGIAIIGVNTTFPNADGREDAGKWQYNVGSGWVNFGSVTDQNALVLDVDASIRFVPNADWNSGDSDQLQPSFTFRGWDQSDGSPSGAKVDASSPGGSSAFSDNTEEGSITVSPVNDAPVLDNSEEIGNPYDMNLDPIDEDNISSPGNTVSEIIDSSQANNGNAITDVDLDDFTDNSNGIPDTYLGEGIAVVEIDIGDILALADGSTTGEGNRWEYSLDGGTTWQTFNPNLSDTNAIVLDSTAKIRFVPDANWHGTAELDVRAWDLTDGLQSGDTGINALNPAGPPNPPNDTSPFSENREIVAITVNPVNDPPTVDLDKGDDSTFNFETDFFTGGDSVPLTQGGSGGDVTDIDDPNMTQLTVIIRNFEAGDVLIVGDDLTVGSVVPGTNITIQSNQNGQIILSGQDTQEHYEVAINSIQYKNTNENLLDQSSRTEVNIDFQVLDDGDATGVNELSNIATATVNILPGGPILSQPDDVTFIEVEDCVPVFIADTAQLDSQTGKPIESMTITIDNFKLGDVLGIDPDFISDNRLSQNYSGGILTIEGIADASVYEQVLQKVYFNIEDPNPNDNENPAENPNPEQRSISVKAVEQSDNASEPGQSNEVEFKITVVPVNDAPTLAIPNEVSTPVDAELSFENIFGDEPIGDVDNLNGNVLVQLSVGLGTIRIDPGSSDATIDNNGGSIITINGNISEVNKALKALTYTPLSGITATTSDVLTITVNDLGNTGINPNDVDLENCSLTGNVQIDGNGQVVEPPNAGEPDDPTAQTITDTIPIRITVSDINVVPETPEPPIVPFLPITRPEGRDLDGITLETVRLPGPVGITEGVGRPIFESRALAGRDFFDFCSIEESLRSHLGCRFANTLNPEAQFGSVSWGDFTDLGWKPPYEEHLDEEYDLYTQLFIREQGDPGFNVEANAFQRDLGGLAEQPPRVFEENAGGQGFNEMQPGEVKKTFFAGREQLDKTGR